MKKSQSGMTLIGWLIVLAFVGFAALIAIRVVPVYMEYFTVNSVVKRLGEARDVSPSNRNSVLTALDRTLQVNSVSGINRNNVSFENVAGGLEVTVKYERRFALVGNLDGVATFTAKTLIPH